MANPSVAHAVLNNVFYHLILKLKVCGSMQQIQVQNPIALLLGIEPATLKFYRSFNIAKLY